jgi:hypothetical protein
MTSSLSRLFGTPRIAAPTLGLLDLSRGESSELAAADARSLGSLFCGTTRSEREVPTCDVLFLYCTLEPLGTIAGYPHGVREVVRDSGARVVVMATPNLAASYLAATRNRRYGLANLVMTLDRKGELFGHFFLRLFGEMKQGTSMPVAWAKLAPQGPDATHADCPETVFACELGQLAFG